MKKINLKNLIYHNYLKTALTSILFIEVALLCLYFYVTSNVVKKSASFIKKDVQHSVYSKINDVKENINKDFSNIENSLKLLQNEHQNFFRYHKKLVVNSDVKFEKAKNGMYYKSFDNGGSSVVVSKNTPVTNSLIEELEKTESFDTNFKTIVNENSLVIAAYFNSRYDYSRYYPYIPNTYNIFPSDINMRNYNFYYEADFDHNPNKDVVWTDVYLDPAGQGWMISSIVPIYYNDKLEGVTGLDITVEKMINNLLKIKLPYKSDSFLLNKDGELVATTQNVNKILGIDNSNYSYDKNQTISQTIYKQDNNILNHKNKDLVKTFEDIVTNSAYKHEILIDGEKYLIFTEFIEKTSWHLISLIKEDEVLADVKELEDYYKSLGVLTICLIILFYIIFFIYLYNKSRSFVKKINQPLLKIISLTKNIGREKHIDKLVTTGIEELDLLNDNFNKMAAQLEDRTNKLIEAQAKKELHEHLSNTDVLTGAYNRRYLNDFTKKYLNIVKREKGTFSLLVIDIDDFKYVNDNFGHDIGDNVLKLLVEKITDVVRSNDIVVRLGGDEFVVLLPDTNLENSKIVAHKILEDVNSIKVEDDNKITKFTISIGTAEFSKNDTDIDTIIKRADELLYKSKRDGKNTVS